MQENKTVFAQKVHSYSKSALQKIMALMTSEEMFIKIRKIVMESDTEQEVMAKLDLLTQKTDCRVLCDKNNG